MRKACARFEQFLKRRFGQSSTPVHYLSDLNIFIHTIGDKEPEAVTATDIDAFIDHQIALGRSPATINRRLSTIHTFFEFLAGNVWVDGWRRFTGRGGRGFGAR